MLQFEEHPALVAVLTIGVMLCFMAYVMGYLSSRQRHDEWDRRTTAGIIGHVALTVFSLVLFGFTAYPSIVCLVFCAGLLMAGLMIGYQESRSGWMAFGLFGWGRWPEPWCSATGSGG